MAQGNIGALRNVSHTSIRGLVGCEKPSVQRPDLPLVPTAVAAALHLPAGRLAGQQLAGSGALVWEGELLEMSGTKSIH